MRITALAGVALIALAPFADASLRIRKNEVLPIILDQDVRIRNAKEGDRVVALAEPHPDLPDGVKVLGEIAEVNRGGRANDVAIRFHTLQMPAGNRVSIQAVPIPLDRAVRKDGRWTASRGSVPKDKAVIGGALGGLILGSLIKKPFEGAVIGTLAGIVVAESSRANDNDLVAPRGTKMGALLLEDVEMDTEYRETERNRERNAAWQEERDERRSSGWPGGEDRGERRVLESLPVFIVDGREVRVGREERPYERDGVWMVPLAATARHLRYELDSRDGRYYVEAPAGSLRLDLGSDEARVNGRPVRLPSRVEKRNRILFVPVQALEALDPDRRFRF